MPSHNSRVLITGGAGFLGSHLTRRLLDSGFEVVVLDFFHQYIFPLAPSFLENMQYRFNVLLKGAEVIRGNINNKEDLRRKLSRAQPDYVIHLAALPLANVALWQTEEAFDSILAATFNLLDVLSDLSGVTKFVYVSSSMVYGDFAQNLMPEDGPKHPKDVYGSLKLAGEIVTQGLCARSNIPYVIVRPSAVYGPTDNNRRVLQIFVENAVQGLPLEVTNPESTYLDFTYVEDAAQGVALAATTDVTNEEFNITRGEAHNLMEAIEILRKFFAPLDVRSKNETDKFRPLRGALDVSKAKRMFRYDPVYSLEKGLALYIDYIRNTNKSLLKTNEEVD